MKKTFKISLNFSMLSIFLTLFITTMLTIITVTTLRLYDSMVVIGDAQMEQVTLSINDKLQSHLQPAELASRVTRELIEGKIIEVDNTAQVLNYTLELLSSLSNAAMVYWGDQQGNFIISRLNSDGTLSSEIIKRDQNTATSTYLTRDKDLNITDRRITEGVTYDPRQRPWYLAAKNAKATTWSDAYIFFSGDRKTLGITLGTPIFDNKQQLIGVFGIDMRLGAISRFLANQSVGKTGVAFIIDNNGKLIAHPRLSELAGSSQDYQNIHVDKSGQRSLAKAFSQHQKTNEAKFTFTDQGETYLSSFTAIPSFSAQKWSIAVVIPENDFIGVLKEATTLTLTLSGIIIFMGILLITVFSRKISKQMNRLVSQTEKIKNFDLRETKKIESHIKEVSSLSEGIYSMRGGLRAFKKYVPADLVRTLIMRHESAKLGGEKKKIAIVFTDIDNFTAISESISPEQLMKHLSVYFDHLARIINRQQGTIDKYIGDAVMAFWGSPLEDKAQSYHACLTALKIQERITKLNIKWQEQNKPLLPTRIGIHTGEAIVGNLGSSERLNYTAIGDTINVASRLESINKAYGTRIIVSESIKKEVEEHFILKHLDCIRVKGKTTNIIIYELVALRGGPNEVELLQLCGLFSQGLNFYRNRQWQDAIDTYQRILDLSPNDSVALMFIERCQLSQKTPPDENWDGVWQFNHKS